MTRARAVALLAVGCVLAALAAGSGPFLISRRTTPPLTRLLREQGILARRRARERGGVPTGIARWLDAVVGYVVLAVAVAVALYALWQFGRALVRLARLWLGGRDAAVVTAPYDRGDETTDDAETALRRRVREELTALSADLDTWPEAREAVIACYARMERALAEAGSPRHPDESPLELVARVLSEQHAPEADVRRLTALFAEARFSRHPVTDDMRDAARRSLDAIAESLAVAP